MASSKTIIIPWTDELEYKIPIPAKKEDVFGWDLPKKQQKWKRIPTPNFLLMTDEEKASFFGTELERLITGVHFMNNGKVEYITGNHYWFLQHWDLGGGKYPRFFYWHQQLGYFLDLCRKDPNCLGAQVLASKRGGKSEYVPCEFLSDSMLQSVAGYVMQAQNDTKVKKLFRRSLRAFHSQKKSLPYTYQHFTTANEIIFRNALVSKKTTKKVSKDDIADSDHVTIGAYPSKIDFIQGETTRGIFMDEYCSQELMDMEEWYDTAVAQCSEGIGKKIIGKIWLIATPERAKSKSLPFAQKLYDDSDPNQRDANGRTKSGLYRMLVPFYESTPDFLDEYGYPDIEAAKKFFANMCEGKTPEKVRELRRKYISNKEDAFEGDIGHTLEADTISVLQKRLSHLNKMEYRGQAHKIYEFNGEIVLEPTPNNPDDDEEENVIIHEPPVANVQYSFGIDGTGTDKQTSETDARKSRFSLVITKKFDPNGKSYCDVAELLIRPDKLEQCYKKALLLAKRYNMHASIASIKRVMVEIWAEGNVGTAPAIVGYFEACGALMFLRKQLKYFGTDSKEELNRLCFYRDATVRETQLFLTNQAGQLYGHNLNSRRLIRNLLLIGKQKTDIADAFQASILGWGAFHQPRKERPKEDKFTYKTVLMSDGTFVREKVKLLSAA